VILKLGGEVWSIIWAILTVGGELVGELVVKIRVFIIFILSSIHCQFPRGSGYTCSQHLVKMQKKKFSCDWKFN
jgi:hypothetical protein